MEVLVACEFSGVVRETFRSFGHTAWSCDLERSEFPDRYHLRYDIFEVLAVPHHWDLLIAHPPCTYLASSGARWNANRKIEQFDALQFVLRLWSANIPKIAIENPRGVLSTQWRPPDQVIHPWQFGHGETKTTNLWLKNLPKLKPTDIVAERVPRVHWESPGSRRWKNRSRTYEGIAKAMAQQWCC